MEYTSGGRIQIGFYAFRNNCTIYHKGLKGRKYHNILDTDSLVLVIASAGHLAFKNKPECITLSQL